MSGLERRSSAELNRVPLSAEEEQRARRYAGERPDVEPTMNRLIATLDAERLVAADLVRLATDSQAILTRYLQPGGLTRAQALAELIALHDSPSTSALMTKASRE